MPGQLTRGPGWEWVAEYGILEVVGDGVVLEGLDVDGVLYIRGLGATIHDTRAHALAIAPGSPANYCRAEERPEIRDLTQCTEVPGISDDAAGGSELPRTVVTDSEIAYPGGPGDTGTCVSGRNVTMIRVDVHGCENGFDSDSYLTVEDSYIHDLYNSVEGDPHTDGLQSAVGEALRLEHNVFLGFTGDCSHPNTGSCNGTSAINIGGQPDQPTVRHTLVRRNLLAGGAYALYCPYLPPTDLLISENHFSTVYSRTAANPADHDRVGEYGPWTDCAGSGVTTSGNVLLDPVSGTLRPLRPVGDVGQ